MRTAAVRSKLLANPLETPPTQEKLIETLQVLYSPYSTQQQRDQADNWIVAFRRTEAAWVLCVNLLPSENITIAHFAAHTLQEKLKTQWGSLTADNQKELISILMHYFCLWSNGPNLLTTRISVTISQIAINVLPSQYTNFLDDVLKLLELPSKDMSRAVLTFLRVLPEEIEDALLTEQKKKSVLKVLQVESPKIIPILLRFLDVKQCNNEELISTALNCLLHWKISTEILLKTPLLDRVLECLNKYDSVVQPASDFLIEIMKSPTFKSYKTFQLEFLKKLISLEQRYKQSIQEQNRDVSYHLTLLFSSLEQFSDLIVSEKELGMKISHLMLYCTSHPDHDISSLSLPFWYELQVSLMSLDTDTDQLQKSWFEDPFVTLVNILRNQCVIPLKMSPEQKHTFTNFRSEVNDSIITAYEFLLTKCHAALWKLLATDLNDVSNPIQWALIEADVFAFKATCEIIDENEDEYVPLLLQSLPKFPMHSTLFQTTLLFLGELAEKWLPTEGHLKYVDLILQYILMGLGSTNMNEVDAAAVAFKAVAEACKAQLVSHLPTLTGAIETLLKGPYTLEVKSNLMEGFVNLVFLLPDNEAEMLLSKILNPIVRDIPLQLKVPESKESLLMNLKLFSDACNGEPNPNKKTQSNQKGHPLIPALNSLWPCLVPIFEVYANDDEIVEIVMKIFKNSMASLRAVLFFPFLNSLLEILCTCYQLNPNEEILKTFSIAVSVYSSTLNKDLAHLSQDEVKNETFSKALSALANQTIQRMNSNLNAWPLTVKTTFDTISHFLRTQPESLFPLPTNPTATGFRGGINYFSVAIAAMPHIEDRQAQKAVVQFITDMIISNNPHARLVVISQIPELLYVTYSAIANTTISRSTIPVFGGILSTIREVYPRELQQVTIELFKDPAFPSTHPTPEAKQKFLVDLFQWKIKDFKEHVHSFAVICRGLNYEFGISTKPLI